MAWIDGCSINPAFFESVKKLRDNLFIAAKPFLSEFPEFHNAPSESFTEVAALAEKHSQKFFEKIPVQAYIGDDEAPSSEEAPSTPESEPPIKEDYSLIELAPLIEEQFSVLVEVKNTSDPDVPVHQPVVSILKEQYKASSDIVARPFTDISPELSKCKIHILRCHLRVVVLLEAVGEVIAIVEPQITRPSST